MNNSPDENPKNQSPKKKSAIVRWIVGGFFAMSALVSGFHFSSLFLLCAAFLMFPLPFMEAFLQNKNIKAIVAIILSVALFFVGVLTSPIFESTESFSDEITQASPTENEDKNDNSTKPDTSTTKSDNSRSNNNRTTISDNTTNEDEKGEMVWIPSSGTKYHSKSNCSGMKSPRQIPLEDAKNQGYTACKKCH